MLVWVFGEFWCFSWFGVYGFCFWICNFCSLLVAFCLAVCLFGCFELGGLLLVLLVVCLCARVWLILVIGFNFGVWYFVYICWFDCMVSCWLDARVCFVYACGFLWDFLQYYVSLLFLFVCWLFYVLLGMILWCDLFCLMVMLFVNFIL